MNHDLIVDDSEFVYGTEFTLRATPIFSSLFVLAEVRAKERQLINDLSVVGPIIQTTNNGS
ncbi:hypothetical protein Golomagni_04956 [Golovinomyces magnicellulatus]|nr:hypothetical protein Golomagni_04956 [Golovinomyces magnicellulatus]